MAAPDGWHWETGTVAAGDHTRVLQRDTTQDVENDETKGVIRATESRHEIVISWNGDCEYAITGRIAYYNGKDNRTYQSDYGTETHQSVEDATRSVNSFATQLR
jgi:hypothetical protein